MGAASGLVAASVVALPVAVLATSFSTAPPVQAYAEPMGYAEKEASRPAPERSPGSKDSARGDESKAEDPPPSDLVRRCVTLIVATLAEVDGKVRVEAIVQALTEQSGASAARGVANAIPNPTSRSDIAAATHDLARQADALLASLTVAETRLVCREVDRRFSASSSGETSP